MNLKDQATEIFKSTLTHVNPTEFLPQSVKWDAEHRMIDVEGTRFYVKPGQKIYVIGFGKASPTMAFACEQIFGDELAGGLIIAPPDSEKLAKTIEMQVGSHPLPDDSSYQASIKLIDFIKEIPDGSVVLNLISGGTSALFCLPAEGITMDDLRQVYKLLLESGASIHEVNTVRKTLSRIKGGQFLKHFMPHRLLDLIISDVPDDDLRYIGSGPTTAQEISYTDAMRICQNYGIWERMPDSAKNHISNLQEEVGVMNTEDFENHYAWILSSAATVAKRTKHLLEEKGFNTTLIHPAWTGLIDDFEKQIKSTIEEKLLPAGDKAALVFYGECTVKVTGSGLGGRNQELVLRMAKQLNNFGKNIAFLSAGTDGIDGPTDVAGAVADQDSWQEAQAKGLDPEKFISENDSYHYFKKAGGHIKTGPTGNNVMDLQIVLTE